MDSTQNTVDLGGSMSIVVANNYTPGNYTFYKKEGVWGAIKPPRFNGGIHGLLHVRRRRTRHVRMRYDRCVAREATSTWVGKLKARLRNSLTIPASKVRRTSLAPRWPGPSPHRAVGVDRPKLKPLERAVALDEGGSSPL